MDMATAKALMSCMLIGILARVVCGSMYIANVWENQDRKMAVEQVSVSKGNEGEMTTMQSRTRV